MLNSTEANKLYTMLANLKTAEEVALVLDDLCTIGEIISLSGRLEVACKLASGKNYSEINTETKVSTATISRVSRCLNYGNGGYKIAIKALGEKDNAN